MPATAVETAMDCRSSLVALLAVLLVACSAGRPPAPVDLARFEAASRDRCAVAQPADFEGAGEVELRHYLQWLAHRRGGDVAVGPRQVNLAIAHGEPKPGLIGVTAAEVACEPGNTAFRITLYREALLGRQLYTAYQAVAHEFQHVVQIRRDDLPCGPREGTREAYEREAAAVAEALVPACRSSDRPAARAAPTGAAASAGR